MPVSCEVSWLVLTWNGGTVDIARLPHTMLSIEVPSNLEYSWLLHRC